MTQQSATVRGSEERREEDDDGGGGHDDEEEYEIMEMSMVVSDHEEYVEVLEINCNCNYVICYVYLPPAAAAAGAPTPLPPHPERREGCQPWHVGAGEEEVGTGSSRRRSIVRRTFVERSSIVRRTELERSSNVRRTFGASSKSNKHYSNLRTYPM